MFQVSLFLTQKGSIDQNRILLFDFDTLHKLLAQYFLQIHDDTRKHSHLQFYPFQDV